MSDHSTEQKIYVIKKVKKVKKHGHHGGAWKIAYADFVTAMMAFFMLMWILGMLNKSQLQGIAEYFNKPVSDVFKGKGHGPNKESGTDKIKEKNLPKLTKDESKKQDNKPMSAQQEQKVIEDLKAELEKKMESSPELKEFKNHLNFKVTAEGLKIELHDLEGKPMFSTGKADFQESANKILSWLGGELNNYPNQVQIIGHTDGTQYPSKTYTNWELSADRANATRRALVKSGMKPEKIIKIVGVADTQQIDKKDATDPLNRRMEIVVLTKQGVKTENNHAPPAPGAPPSQPHAVAPAASTPAAGPTQTSAPAAAQPSDATPAAVAPAAETSPAPAAAPEASHASAPAAPAAETSPAPAAAPEASHASAPAAPAH